MTNRTQREHLFAAMESVQQLLNATEIAPTSIDLLAAPNDRGPYSLRVNFHHRPMALAQFAADLGLPVTYTGTFDSEDRPYLTAQGNVFGVEVRVWDLGNSGEHEQYLAAVAPTGLPAAWSAKAVAA